MNFNLLSNFRYSTIGRPGRGLHHHLHNTSGISNSPVRSVVIVAPGDPIPPNLPPQQQLQLQQLSTDLPPHQLTLTRPPSEASSNLYGWHRPILKRSCSLCDCHQIVREKRNTLFKMQQLQELKNAGSSNSSDELLLMDSLAENVSRDLSQNNRQSDAANSQSESGTVGSNQSGTGCENNHFLQGQPVTRAASNEDFATLVASAEVVQYDTRL